MCIAFVIKYFQIIIKNNKQSFQWNSLFSDSPNGTNGGYTCKRKRLYAAAPGRKCMCIKSYQANAPGELSINKGDILESMSLKILTYMKIYF